MDRLELQARLLAAGLQPVPAPTWYGLDLGGQDSSLVDFLRSQQAEVALFFNPPPSYPGR